MHSFFRHRLSRTTFLIVSGLMLMPSRAFAQADEFAQVFLDIGGYAIDGLGLVATIALVVMSLRMVGSVDENALSRTKYAVGAVIGGLMLTMLTRTIFEVLYIDQLNGLNLEQWRLRLQLMGVASWFQALAIILGVFTIIITAFRAILSFGDTGTLDALRKQLLYTAMGMILILMVGVSQWMFTYRGETDTLLEWVLFVDRTPNALVDFIFTYVTYGLGFITLVMILIIIYAGSRLIINSGNESAWEESRGLIVRVIIGFLLVLFSFAIVQFVLEIFGSGAMFFG